MEELLEGKLEALPRDPEELGWAELWMLSVIGACLILTCMMLTHAAMV